MVIPLRLSVTKQEILDFLAVPVLFFFVYRIYFIPVLNTSMIMTAFMMPALLVAFTNAIKKLKVKKWLFATYALLISMIILSIFYPALHRTNDYNLANLYIVMFIESLIGALGFYYIFLKNKDLTFLCRCIVWITILQCLIILSMIISPEVRDFIFHINFGHNEYSRVMFAGWGDAFRGMGLAAELTVSLAMVLSIGMMLSSYMVFVKRQSILFYSFAWIINFTCILIVARTGFVGIAFSLLILAYAYRNLFTLKRAISFVFGIFLFLGIGIICLSILSPQTISLFYNTVVFFAFEMFISLYETGRFGTGSTDTLMTMYFPISLRTLFTGDGYFAASPSCVTAFYMGTDAGYMRHILFYGILPSLILYFSYILAFWLMIKRVSCDKLFAIIILLLGGYFFIVHYKDNILASAMITKPFFVLFVYIASNKKDFFRKLNTTHSINQSIFRPNTQYAIIEGR